MKILKFKSRLKLNLNSRLSYLFLALLIFGNYAIANTSKAEDLTVNQLSDIKTTDWTFTALQSLTERYGCIQSYPDRAYRGNVALTRYEFAAGLKSCINKVDEMIRNGLSDKVSQEDLNVLNRLQSEFTSELGVISQKVNNLEQRTEQLEAQNFSPTTKLSGQVIFALSAGSFSGDRILSPTGAVIARNQPNVTFLNRFSLDLNTSFGGKDLLKIRLLAGSAGATDSTSGFLEPNFASALDYSIQGRDNQVSLTRLYYSFNIADEVRLTLAPFMVSSDFIDKNRYANISFNDFSTQAFINNFILLPRPAGAGVVVEWVPKQLPIQVRALYVAANANRPTGSAIVNNLRSSESAALPVLIFPNRGGEQGLFGDPYQGVLELEYSPDKNFALRLQYAGGKVIGSTFNAFGVNFDWGISDRIGVFGRYGLSSYNDTEFGNINPNYWMAGFSFKDLLTQGSITGIAVGQPLIVREIGNATQTNFEAFYSIPINKFIRITPLIQVITNAGNRSENGTIFVGALRTVFSF
jgi:porin